MGQKKRPYVFFILLLLLILAASYYMSGLFCDGKPSLLTLEADLVEILSHPFRNYWNDKSAVCLCTGLLGWMYFLTWYSYHNRDFMFGREHGSAKWEDAAEVSRCLRDPDPKKNRIVSRNLEYSMDALPNNNMLVIGSPGTGKTAFLVTPNLLRMLASYIILDVKGDLLYQYGSYLKAHGYQIRVLDLKDKNRSDCYNPFAYMRSEEDVIRAVKNIQEATTPPDAHKGEPFWEDGAAMYMKALFCYVLYELPPEERNMGAVVGPTREEMEVLDEEKGVTRLSLRMERLKESPQGIAHPAYVNYKKLKEGASETVASLVLIVNTKL